MREQLDERHFNKPKDHRQNSNRFLWIRLGITTVAILCIIAGVFLNIKGILQSSTILTILGVIIGLFQWLFPLHSRTHETSLDVLSHPNPQQSQPSSETNPLPIPEFLPQIWNFPYRRNPFFTGREDILSHLHDMLTTDKTTALLQPYAINGLGGIGKTQIAVEYAYRYYNEYRFVLWARAATRDTLIADFVTLADLLHMPEKNEQDQNIVVDAVKRWLANHSDWLLILDNADDLRLIRDFLPIGGNGHVLLTTRAQAIGPIAENIEVEKMNQEDGTLLLLRRAKVLATNIPLAQASKEDRAQAEVIVTTMDGLPLALDQAGAYIEETGCNVRTYLERYQQRRATLLKRRGGLETDHPEPVITTWSLSFDQIEQEYPPAADLLRFCAFLSPDAIPEEMIMEGVPELGPLLEPIATDGSVLDEAIGALRRFSLVRRNAEVKTLSVHRLVQAVLKDGMTNQTQKQWIERTVRAVNRAFPSVEVATWPVCQRCLPHALACVDLINQYGLVLPVAAQLLGRTGRYLYERAQYSEAEQVLKRTLEICEQTLGLEHPDTASSLDDLAKLYHAQGQYEQAKSLLERALTIRERLLGSEHPDTASSLNNLAALYRIQGQYEQAEPLLQRALMVREQVLGPEHPDTANSLNNLAALYRIQGQYEQAEPLLQRALTIREQVLGPEHPDTAISLNNLAEIYHAQGNYEQAELLLHRALRICEEVFWADHPYTATSLNNLANLYYDQGNYEQAETLLQRALSSREQVLGPDHPYTAICLNNLARLYYIKGQYERAESLYQHALAIYEKSLGPKHRETINVLMSYADLLRKMNRADEAATLEARAKALL